MTSAEIPVTSNVLIIFSSDSLNAYFANNQGFNATPGKQPKILAPFNAGWVKFGEILGSIIAPIVMFIIFSIIVTPIGLALKLFGKDLLKMKKNKITKTYWILRENVKSMKRQF